MQWIGHAEVTDAHGNAHAATHPNSWRLQRSMRQTTFPPIAFLQPGQTVMRNHMQYQQNCNVHCSWRFWEVSSGFPGKLYPSSVAPSGVCR
mmetsp:Transcript_91219/g.152805  ORF Transcript_91219/g.152805 Transcript_91219/m.152805 type:complete len:91 (+) Transcript_91219:2223-2495(+)